MAGSERLVMGCMTGTSLDGLDAVAARVAGRGLGLSARVVGTASRPMHIDGLAALARGEPMRASDVARLALELGEAHRDVLVGLADGQGRPDMVAAHGQTVFHGGGRSWQLLNAWPIARALGCPVVTDLRGADLSAGGEGAPITPLADWVLFRSAEEVRVIVNLGGFCNATLLPAGAGPQGVRGIDVCACNQVLDEAARRLLRAPFDEGGRGGAGGRVDGRAREELVDALGSGEGRSLGTGDEAFGWVDAWAGRLAARDVLATACGAIGSVIGSRIRAMLDGPARVLLAGGGARNGTLVEAISRECGGGVETLGAVGVDPAHREAAAMAVLGALAADGEPITLPAVTGAGEPLPLAGAWINATPRIP